MTVKRRYKFAPKPGMWGLLTLLTIGLGIACLAGAPISPWWILAPLGIPLGLMILTPLYAIFAIILVALIALILVIVGIIPCLLLALVLGIRETTYDSLLD